MCRITPRKFPYLDQGLQLQGALNTDFVASKYTIFWLRKCPDCCCIFRRQIPCKFQSKIKFLSGLWRIIFGKKKSFMFGTKFRGVRKYTKHQNDNEILSSKEFMLARGNSHFEKCFNVRFSKKSAILKGYRGQCKWPLIFNSCGLISNHVTKQKQPFWTAFFSTMEEYFLFFFSRYFQIIT